MLFVKEVRPNKEMDSIRTKLFSVCENSNLKVLVSGRLWEAKKCPLRYSRTDRFCCKK